MLWCAFAAITSFDLLYLVSGRTGYMVFVAMLMLLLVQYRTQLKKYWIAILLVFSVLISAVILTSPAIQSRSNDLKIADTNLEGSAVGQRLIFWQTSLHIIADHPLLGSGTGSFANEFTKHAYEDHPNFFATNPHNEYLLIACQLGLVGLLSFLWLLYSQLKHSKHLPPMYGVAAQGLVVAMAVGCLFNSFLRDHGEGHFYAIFMGLLFSTQTFAKANEQ
jgi:O-antigen ligase